jgi:L-lactate dehydrogenase (cytochrome)
LGERVYFPAIVIQDELETSMRLVGITDLSEAHLDHVNIGDISHLIPTTIKTISHGKWRRMYLKALL